MTNLAYLTANESSEQTSASTKRTSPQRPKAPTAIAIVDLKIDPTLEKLNSFIAEGDTIGGNVETKGGLRVAGIVLGDVNCLDGSLIVEKTGHVHGNAKASMRVIVDGGTIGSERAQQGGATTSVECPEEVVVTNQGRINADVKYGLLATYDGGRVTGRASPIEDAE